MPRINIEESLWSDDRYQNLTALTGNRAIAAGAIILAFVTAQKYWIPNKHPIPKKEWDRLSLSKELVDVGMAEIMEDGVYVKGSKDQFNWWFKKQESGRIGGLAKASNAKHISSDVKQNVPSSSSSSSSSRTITTNVRKEERKQVGRVLEPGEVERFTENLRTSLEIEKKPVSRGLVVGYLRTFDTPKDAEDHIEGVFKSAVSKASEVDGQVKYIQAAMANHTKQELAYGN